MKNKPDKSIDSPDFTAHWAKHWGVNVRTVQRWLRRGDTPRPDDIEAMIRWAATPGRKPIGVLRKVAELRAETRGRAYTDPDWADFERQTKLAPSDNETQQTLERLRDFYTFKLHKANAASDENSIRIYSDLVIKYEKAIRDNALAAKKLGVDVGELLPRPEVERIIFAFAYWMMRSADLHIDELTGSIAAMAPGIDRDAVRNKLDGELLSTRMLIPFARAAHLRAGISLPDWLVAKMRATIGDYLENGEASFDAEFAAAKRQ